MENNNTLTPELKEAFEKILDADNGYTVEFMRNTVIEAMHAAYTLGRDAEKWISVEERLPDTDTKCSVFVNEGATKTYYEVWYHPEIKQWWCDGKQVLHASHWQPLPPSPLR
jgi:hypothetical protein